MKKRIALAELSLHEINTDFLKHLDYEKRHIFEFKIYPDFYERLKKFRNNYTKCINCKEYFIGSKPKGFCDKRECQESKSSFGGSKRTSIEKLIKLPIDKDLLRLLDSEKRYFYEFKNYPEFLNKLEEFRNTVTKCKVCGDYFDEPSKKCGTGYCDNPACQEVRKSKESDAFDKRANTNLKKYGVKNASENKEIANKIGSSNKLKKDTALIKRKETNLKKFGAENPMHLDSTKEKMKQTNLEKYGSEYFVSSGTGINKIKETFIEKYGSIENKNKIVSKKAKESWNYVDKEVANKKREITNIKKYGSLENRNKIASENIKRNNISKYGIEYAAQRHFKNKNDLNSDFFKKFIDTNNFFDIDECCKHFGFSRLVAMKFKKQFKIINPNISKIHVAQKLLFENIKVKNKLLDTRQIIKPFELDIFLPDYNLAVEYNGIMFHSFGISDYSMFNNINIDKNIHYKKFEMCEKLGINLLNIFEGENTDIWLKNIHRFFNLEDYKIKIEEFNEIESIEFLWRYSINFKYTKNLKYFGFKLNNKIENLIAFKNNFIYYIESKNNFNINFIEFINTNFKSFYFKDNLRNSLRRFFNFEFIKRYKPNCYLVENSELIKLFKMPKVSEKRFTFDCGFDVLKII